MGLFAEFSINFIEISKFNLFFIFVLLEANILIKINEINPKHTKNNTNK